MSFFKDVFRDFTRKEPINADKVKTSAWSMLAFGVLLFLLFLNFSLWDAQDTIFFENVHAKNINPPPEITVDLSFGSYTSGHDGTLLYKPMSFIDRLLFESLGSLNLLDFLFFLYVGVTLFIALRNVQEERTFKKKISSAYKKIGMGCVWMFMAKMIYDGILIPEFFEYRTGHQFYLPNSRNGNVHFLYAFLGSAILPFVYFMNKGEALQQEQDLTI